MFFTFPESSHIAKYVTAQFIDLIQIKPNAVLGLATGSTMEPVYQRLIEQLRIKNIDVSHLTTFNLDEYIGLAKTHPQSYYYYMQQHLFNHLNFNASQVFLPDGLGLDLMKQCQEYSEQIVQMGGLDLQLLGIGTNGHIGFNEPGTSFQRRTHVVDLSEQTRLDNGRFFETSTEVPTQAVTLGLQDIAEAKKIILVATGANKAQVMLDLYNSAVDESMPASILKQHPNTVVIVDKAAAALLPVGVCKTIP